MPSVRSRTLVRGRGEGEARVTPFELFFDLVFVFAVTQLSHRLLEQLTISGAAETLLLLLAVWLAWTYTTWVANWFDPDQLAVRLMLVAVMLASLAMSASIPDAFGDRGLGFAGAFVAIHVGRTLFVLTALDRDNALTAHFRRVLCWTFMSAPLWLAGAFAERDVRIALWLVAVVLDLTAPMFGFRVPGLGRDRTRDLRIEGGHLAHRYYLFVILALGESILVIGATFSQLPVSGSRFAAFVIAFLGSVALWEIYFARSEAGGHRATREARLGRREARRRRAAGSLGVHRLPPAVGGWGDRDCRRRRADDRPPDRSRHSGNGGPDPRRVRPVSDRQRAVQLGPDETRGVVTARRARRADRPRTAERGGIGARAEHRRGLGRRRRRLLGRRSIRHGEPVASPR